MHGDRTIRHLSCNGTVRVLTPGNRAEWRLILTRRSTMANDQQEIGTSVEVKSTARTTYDRRMLMRRGLALGAGLAGTGTLARLGYAAQQETATPDAGLATPAASNTTQIVAAANTFLGTLSDAEKESVLFDWS